MKKGGHYKEIKAFMLQTLQYRPFLSNCTCPVEWAKSKLPLVTHCVHHEDYEGAQACKDAIREFLNKFLPDEHKIDEDDTLILPEYEKLEIKGIICMCGNH